MGTSATPRPAPGDLRLVQDLVNTLDVGSGRDALDRPETLAAWLAVRDLLSSDTVPGDTVVGEAEWRAALDLRQGLRALIAAEGGEIDPDDLARLHRTFGGLHHVLCFARDGSLHFEPAGEPDGWEAVVGRFLTAVYQADLAGEWRRLKLCHRDGCRRAFYDGSRSRRGRWCDPRCGAPGHSKAYRRRGRAGKRGRLTNNLIR